MHFQNNQTKSSPLSLKASQFPSTSAGIANTNPFSLFNSQFLPTSPQNATIQAVANTILHSNSFINPIFPMAAAVDFSRMQQWFQNNNNHLTNSPLGSKTPSLISNMSGLSTFTNGSFTSNTSQFGSKYEKSEKPLLDNKHAIKAFLEIFRKDVDSRIIKTLQVVIGMIREEKIPNDAHMDIQEIIELLINYMSSLREQRMVDSLVDILATITTTKHFKMLIRKKPNQMMQIFVNLSLRYANNKDTDPNRNMQTDQRERVLSSLLRIICYALYEVEDKRVAKTLEFFSFLLKSLQINETKTRLFALEILRHLLYRDDEWKKFVASKRAIDLILNPLLNNQNSPRFIRQSIRTLNTLVDSHITEFSSYFIELKGIETIVRTAELSLNTSVFSSALLCLKLVSDRPSLAKHDLTKAICFAVHCTNLSAYEKNESKSKMYWNDIANALAFLRNALALNDAARCFLASKDECKAVQHFTTLAALCFDLKLPPNTDGINIGLDRSKTKIDPTQKQYLGIIFEHCLAILALLNKEDVCGNLSEGQKLASQKLCDNRNTMFLYQFLLKLDNLELQKIVLTSLRRSTQAGASVLIESGQMRMAETLVNFLFAPNADINRLPLMVIAAEVLVKLASDSYRPHLSVMTPLLSTEACQPFKLLERIINTSMNTDLCLALLNLMNELCLHDTNLKTLWFHNDNNVNFMKYLTSTSTNPEIVHLCSTLQNQIGEENFYDIFTQAMEYDNQGVIA